MKPQYIRDLTPDQPLNSTFLVSAKEVRRGKNGDPYLLVTLSDRTGEIEARAWDNVQEVADSFDVQDFVRVRGAVQLFQTRLQVVIHKIQPVAAEEQDLRDYLPTSKNDLDRMWADLLGWVGCVQNPHLRSLLEQFVNDPVLTPGWKVAPAAKTVHHAYLGGLVEHTLSMCQIAKSVAAHYGDVDLDLLLTGVILHDVGKAAELSYQRAFAYTSEGQMLGHIIIGMRWLDDKAKAVPGFPPKLLTLLQHMILSHHGTEEFGSPKPPVFLEAVLLNQIDSMDAKYQAVRDHMERDRGQDPIWTGYNSALERPILRTSAFLSDAPAEPKRRIPDSPPAAAEPRGTSTANTNSAMAEKLQAALKK